jgi:hypothetical protein
MSPSSSGTAQHSFCTKTSTDLHRQIFVIYTIHLSMKEKRRKKKGKRIMLSKEVNCEQTEKNGAKKF